MEGAGLAAALTAATIWALVIFLYKRHMENVGAATVNFSRLLYVSLFMWPVLLGVGDTKGIWAAALSGVVTLLLGDSLYFYAIHKVGGSVAAPVVYTYVIIAQYFALLLGERVTPLLFLSSALVVLGVALLARGGEERMSPVGLAAAFGATLLWSLGMTAVKLASLQGVPPAAIAYIRALSACVPLGVYLAARGRLRVVKSPAFAAASILDLGVGSTLFAFSVEKVGLAITTILVSMSPLVTQLYAKASGIEQITPRQALGAVAIFIAIAITMGVAVR
ncbi:MAG: DMT family transporter [Pyrobaculum sp.]